MRFAETVKGVNTSANLYGMVETAKLDRLENPNRYLCRLYEDLPKANILDRIEALLPGKPRQGRNQLRMGGKIT